MEAIERLLNDIIKGIVEQPEQVQLNFSTDTDENGELTIINVKVAKEDVGVCIGQKGSTAEAIRKLVGMVGYKQLQKRIYVKIDAPRIPKNHYGYEDQVS